MHTPRELYELLSIEDGPVVPRGLPLISMLPGVVDAGHVCQLASDYLRDSLPYEEIVRFFSDELIDYRSSRPTMLFDRARFEVGEFPRISIDLMSDDSGHRFLLLHGPEPDLRWEGCAEAIIDVCETFEVSEHVSMRAVPAEVPHTRMIPLITHANSQAEPQVPAEDDERGAMEFPGSFSSFLETRMETAGIASRGFIAQVPHYLMRGSMPGGALALLRRVSETLSLEIPLADLGDVVSQATRVLELEMEDNADLAAHVAALEENYDAATAESEDHMTVLDMPTAHEIGERLERFLAEEAGDG